MANFYSVSSASYDGTSGSANPLCNVVGMVNGRNVFAPVYFSYLQAASEAGMMRQALTAILFNSYAENYGFQFLPWPTPLALPTFPGSNIAAEHTEGVYPVAPVVVDAALIGAWIA